MNRRRSRIAVFVVLLVSMLAVYQGGSGFSPGTVLAQGPSCGDYHTYADSSGTPAAEALQVGTPNADGSFQVDSVYQAVANQDPPLQQTLIQVTLLEKGEFSLVADGNAIVRVDSGVVTLWNCGDTTIQVLTPGNHEPIPVEPGGAQEMAEGQAIVVNGQTDVYYLTPGTKDQAQAAEGGVQQLSSNFAVDALPGVNQPSSNSRVSGGTVSPFKLCSRGIC